MRMGHCLGDYAACRAIIDPASPNSGPNAAGIARRITRPAVPFIFDRRWEFYPSVLSGVSMPFFRPLKARRLRGGFTLIELLVSVAIISLLIAILLPSLGAARARGRRTACSSNLRQLAIGMRSYLDSSGDIFPHASFMPSVDPFPIGMPTPDNPAPDPNPVAIYLADVLAPHVGDSEKVFACPDDNGQIVRGAPNEGRSYFSTEKSSYEYRFRLGGISIAESIKRMAEFTGRTINENTLWILRDYDNFHGPGGKPGARRYVYYDTHVTDFEN